MARKSKNIETSLSDFLSYSNKSMDPEIRNKFERELQKDPFADEAAEGFSEISAEEVSKDLEALGKRLRERTSGRKKWMAYRIAASVAVLMVLSTVVVVIWRAQNATSRNSAIPSVSELVITEGEPLQQITGKEKSAEDIPPGIEKTEDPVRDITSDEAAGGVRAEEREKTEAQQAVDIVPEREIAAVSEVKPLEELAARPAKAPVMVRAAVKTDMTVRGSIISSEDNLPLPGASVILKGTSIGTITDSNGKFSITVPDSENEILQAAYIGMETKEFPVTADSEVEVKLNPSAATLNEAVVIGYGAAKRIGTAGDEAKGQAEKNVLQYEYSPPEPETGKEMYNEYIEKNIRRPANLKTGQKVVVVLGFTVKADGSVSDVRILRSPDTQFSDEAKRLLEEGPAWKPATENGISVDDDVRLRIVFR